MTRPIVNSVAIHRYSTFLTLSIGMLLCSSLLVSYPSVLAQTNGGVATQNQGAQGGILEKISDKGNYRVQILWNQLTSLGGSAIPSPAVPKQGFEMEIDFLNASAPLPTAKTVPQKETGIRSESPVGGSVNQIPTPSIIQTTVPVDSYDITIYTDHGQELWKKLNQPVTGGRGVQRVIFENSDYSGGITIQITNIKSGDIPPNAVTFTARIS
ncbi:MAG: hypothetical protein ACJ71J_17760 [Nitrososphaeraceae archaeon]